MPKTSQNIDRLISDALAIEAESAINAGKLGYYARVLAQATMPHKRTDANEHVRKNGGITLSMLSPSNIGLPYGSVPRLLLSWLTTEAKLKGEREIYLGDSLTDFIRNVGILKENELPTGGKTGNISRVKTQARKLFNTTVNFTYDAAGVTADKGFRVSSESITWWDAKSPNQKSLWQSRVLLTTEFFDEITDSPIPVDLRALRTLRRRPLALDLYCWLTYRMSYLNKRTEIPWGVLKLQFGADYSRVRDFKGKAIKELAKVMVVYPGLHVGEGKRGLILHPSPPHIAKRGVSFLLTNDNE